MERAAPTGPAIDPPSRVMSVVMILIGVLFLLPFLFLGLSGGSPRSFVAAFLSVGWTFGLGVVFLLFGWSRLRAAKEGPEDDGDDAGVGLEPGR